MSDAWRLQMLDRATSDPDHVYAKFGTGNIETLDSCPKGKGQNVRDELLKFHSRYYSANIMGLSVIGRESLDELEKMVTGMFSEAVNKEVQVPSYDASPYRKEDMAKRCISVPVKDIRLLVLSFPIPDLFNYYDSKPEHYISHLIGHEGCGSLLSELKNKGWVNWLVAGPSGGSRGFDFMSIQVDLTATGIDHVDDIIMIMLQYIKLLREEGPKEWIFNELRDVAALSFDFKDKEKPITYVTKLSSNINWYPMEKVLTGSVLMKENNPEMIKTVLDKLTPDNMKIAVLSQAYKGKTDKTEKWYGTEYSLMPIENSLLERWRNAPLNQNLRLPDINEFIPTKLDVKELSENNPDRPRLVKNDGYSMVWFRQDDTFKLPKACVFMDFYSPFAYVDPHHCNMLHMFVDLFEDALNEYSYNATIAGLAYELENTRNGMMLSISGYEDRQAVMLDKILAKITDFEIDTQRFTVLKELYQRSLQNFAVEQPYHHSMYYSTVLRSEVAWTKREKYDALPKLTVDNLNKFIPTLLSQLHVEMLCFGNLTKDDALKVENTVMGTLRKKSSTRSLLPSQIVHPRNVELPHGSAYVYKQKHEFREISAVHVFFQIGMQNLRENVLLDLMAQIISEPFFNVLRTKEQLGYIVHSGVKCSNDTQGLRFLVQSDKSPEYLEARVEAYVDHISETLANMDITEFDKHKNALKTKKLEKPKKLKSQAARYWGEILSKQYMFGREEIEAEEISAITKDDVIKFYNDYLNRKGAKRAKLTTYIIGKHIDDCPSEIDTAKHNSLLQEGLGLLQCPELQPSVLIEDISKFKCDLPLFPRLEPYIDLSQATIAD